jgi:polyhydroxybutyrate depolymerase
MGGMSGGSGGRGGTGGTGGTGGSSGGSGGGSAGAGGGGGKVAANPSAGCGKASPQTGSSGQPLNVSGHNYYVKLPASYNAATPYKVMIVFPPTGNPITWSEQSAGYEQTAPDAIRVYTHMSVESSGWQPNETSFFKPLYDKITGDYCIDKNRVFAGGESSGGEFAGFVGCENGDLLRGVVPNAPKMTSWKIDPASHTCKGNPTAIVSWSEKDNVLQQPAGSAFRDFYRTLNMCQTTSTAVQGYTDALSNCKLFDGCKEGSNVYYCMHSDPNYGNTYHGWPGFMAKMSWGVFSAL